jgi:hypothetical protein
VAGPCEIHHVQVAAGETRPEVSIPIHQAGVPATGRAGKLQEAADLPEPWIDIQVPAAGLADFPVELASEADPEIRRPQRASAPAAAPPHRNLNMGEIEQPGAKWVLLRGSSEAATFRMALDSLRLQEPGARRTEWGPPAIQPPSAHPPGLPDSRGMVYRDLGLQVTAAEPLLEPLVCQFGSARGGQWDSRT